MHETLPCKLCGCEINEGQLCDRCLGLAEHRNILNGIEEESVKEETRLTEYWTCQDCGNSFTPWQNGSRLVRKVCEPCTKRKRSEAQKKYHKGLKQEPSPEPCDYFVGFGAEPELAGRIAVSATRFRRTFEQQVFWIIDSALKSVEE